MNNIYEETKFLMKKYNITANKNLGQNFLIDDETVEKISEALPGANCGGCGYSGCEGYAEAVAKGLAPTNLCKPGGKDVTVKISAVMGVEAVETEREVAFVRCNGNWLPRINSLI